MKFHYSKQCLAALAVCAGSASSAQDLVVAQLQPMVVTATRLAQPASEVLADVTVIQREDIERSGASTLADVLSRAPGVEFSRNGGPGGTTSLFLRGADTRHTVLLIDGMRVNSQSTGGPAWNAIPCAQIDRIEIVRGAASSVYGSDAVAGVIQVFTRRGEAGFFPMAELGLGSQGTARAAASVGGGDGKVDYFLGVERQASKGYGAIVNPASYYYVADRDGYHHESATAGVGMQLNQQHRLEASLLWADLDAQYDGSSRAPLADDHSLYTTRSGNLRWLAQFSPQWRSQLALGDSVERYETLPSPYLARTHLTGLTWQNDLRLGAHGLQFTLERKHDALDNAGTGPNTRNRNQNSVALAYTLRQNGHLLQANLRHDRDSEFGGQTTGGLALAYRLAPAWKVTAAVGTSFMAPTLYQRFSDYGQAGLQPEKGLNREIGVAYEQGGARAGVVVYRNHIDQLITFGTPGVCTSAFGCYRNTAQAVLSGVTLSAAGQAAGARWTASLDLQDPRDLVLDKRLRRRAATLAKLGALAPWMGGQWGADLQWSGKRYEDAANTQVLAGYALLSLHATYQLAPNWQGLVRVDNLTNAQYQLAKDYATPGRTLYVGLKWAPK